MARMKALKRTLSDSDSDSGSDGPVKGSTKPVKKARKSTQVADGPPRTAEELSKLSHDELIQHILTLQSRLEAATTPHSKSTAPASSELSKELLAKKVTQLRSLMERQIRKAMTWKPSCKTGGATFSQDFLVPVEEVARTVLRGVVSEKDEKKGWKLRKFGVEEFEVCDRMIGGFEVYG